MMVKLVLHALITNLWLHGEAWVPVVVTVCKKPRCRRGQNRHDHLFATGVNILCAAKSADGLQREAGDRHFKVASRGNYLCCDDERAG